jgi:hypothetical protein
MHSYNLACTVLVIRYKTSVLLSDILDHCLKERLEIKMMHNLNPDARILLNRLGGAQFVSPESLGFRLIHYSHLSVSINSFVEISSSLSIFING